MPMINLFQVAQKIASLYATNSAWEHNLTYQVFGAFCEELADEESKIIQCYMPKDEDAYDECTVEFKFLYDFVKEKYHLSWGDCFLIDLDY